MSRNLTYRELIEVLSECSDEELEQSVTIFVPGVDEYYPATLAWTDDDCDVLDPGHMVLTVK